MNNLIMKPFIIEVWENGKVSLPAFVTVPEQQLSIDELKKCRAYLDLIISNPDNFHVVKADGAYNPLCKDCDTMLTVKEINASGDACFACEKKSILKASNVFNPVSCMVCEGEFDNPMQAQLGLCGKCMKKQAKPKNNNGNVIPGDAY